jgi:hypothetical protein
MTTNLLEKHKKLQTCDYTPGNPTFYYTHLPGRYEDAEGHEIVQKNCISNISIRFLFWKPWYKLIIAFALLPEKDKLNAFIMDLRQELKDLLVMD